MWTLFYLRTVFHIQHLSIIALSPLKKLISKLTPQKECKNSQKIIFTLQHKHYLWIACTEKQSSQASVNSAELPFRNSYCLTKHLSRRSNASQFLCTKKSSNSGSAQARSSMLVFQTSSLGNPCLHKTEIIYLEASCQIPGIWHYTYFVVVQLQ